MNVTQSNFSTLLPTILKDISNANFISFDSEFSGLGLGKNYSPDLLDAPQKRYEKVSKVCTQFLPLQIGICCFEYKKEGFYVAKPYNFHIFPRTGNRLFGLDRVFYSQVSSLEFLVSNNFDLNNWATNGISFVNRDDHERIMLKLDALDEAADPPKEGESLYEFSQECISLTKEFLQKGNKKSFLIPTASSFHRRVVHLTIAKEFNGFVTTTSQGNQNVELTKLTSEERDEANLKSRSQLLKNELDDLVGFRKVVDALSTCGKALVGHNLLFDLCYIFHHFYRQLPEDFEDFKRQVHALFPLIIDTKLIAQTNADIQLQVKNTVLGDMAEVFQKEPFEEPKIVFGREFDAYQSNEKKYHEAGYDAYITGLSLLRMHHYKNDNADLTSAIDCTLESLSPNKIFFMRSLMTFMSLDGQDDVPDTSNIFMLSDFPAAWKSSDIQTALKELGYINLKWIDDQSCLVIIRDRQKVAIAEEMTKRVVKKSSNFVLKAFINVNDDGAVVVQEDPSAGNKRKRTRVVAPEGSNQPVKKAKKAKTGPCKLM